MSMDSKVKVKLTTPPLKKLDKTKDVKCRNKDKTLRLQCELRERLDN